jgi:hypothetical protein
VVDEFYREEHNVFHSQIAALLAALDDTKPETAASRDDGGQAVLEEDR